MTEKILDPAKIQADGYSQIILLNQVGSTNEYARQLLTSEQAESLGQLSLVSTADQVQGKGRLDRVWSAPAGTSLSTSFIVRPHAEKSVSLEPASYHWFTLLTAISAVRTLEDLGIEGTNIKWPNDLLIREKKVSGVLAQLVAEASGNFSVVSGIGINLNQQEKELPVPTATSAALETGKTYDLSLVLARLAKHFADYYDSFAKSGADPHVPLHDGSSLLETARFLMSTIGQEVTVHLPGGQSVQGRAEDINDEGEILVRTAEGLLNFAVGDIVHLRPKSDLSTE